MVTTQYLPLRLMADSLINKQQSSETNIQRINMHLDLRLLTVCQYCLQTGDRRRRVIILSSTARRK